MTIVIRPVSIEPWCFQKWEWEWMLYIFFKSSPQSYKCHYRGTQKTKLSQNQWTNIEMGNWTKQNFLKGKNLSGQKHMKKCSPSVAIKEMQIKTTLRFHLTPVRVASIKNTTNNKCWGGCGEKGTLTQCWWECKLVQPLWKTIWRLLKKLNIDCCMIQQSHS
jgi:hypothetical protein